MTELVAAQMLCHSQEHETALYVYEAATETVYFDQVPEVTTITEADETDEH